MSTATYCLNIDEDGFPVLSGGVRASDEVFLSQVFRNMKRYHGDDRAPLCTLVDRRDVMLTSFSDPLVAQEVEGQGETLTWNFLGGLKADIHLSELLEDEWQRLHAYVGAEKIPAVMSRKAQAAFLLAYPHLEKIKPKPYRFSSEGVALSLGWDERYKTAHTPWDIGAPNPVFLKHSKMMLKESGPKWLMLGAGLAHESVVIEKAGKELWASDLSPTAKEAFHKLYPQSKCHYEVGDFFVDKLPTFDALFENYFFVAIDPKLRKRAIDRMYELLNPGAFYGGVFYARQSAGGPPFGLSEWELKQYIQDKFEIVQWERSLHSHPRRMYMEFWVLLRKI